MIHSILLIGQSNMAGRGFANEVEPINNEKIKVMRNGRWWDMYTPVNPDRVTAGVSLAESFADLYAKEHDADVGLIPCADGGTCLDQWQVGGLLFDHACYMAELAMRTSTIAAVLWHQGESDCGDSAYPMYEKKLSVIMEAFRERLGLNDVPFILGGLGDFIENFRGKDGDEYHFANSPRINAALKSYADKTDMTGFVSAEGLTPNPDGLHFNAKSLREFGIRYYNEFKKLEDKNKIFSPKPDWNEAVRSELESL